MPPRLADRLRAFEAAIDGVVLAHISLGVGAAYSKAIVNLKGAAQEAAAALDRTEALEQALRTIRDESADTCQCEHDTEDCCVKNGGHCAFCTADTTLAALSGGDPQ